MLERKAVQGHLRFTNIHFRYPTRPSVRVLRGLNLDVAPGSESRERRAWELFASLTSSSYNYLQSLRRVGWSIWMWKIDYDSGESRRETEGPRERVADFAPSLSSSSPFDSTIPSLDLSLSMVFPSLILTSTAS